MRIISGKLKGRRIHAPGALPARPTTDFAKTGLFNILQHRIEFENCNVLDLFGGTGSITLEFASRGAQSVTYVDENIRCWKFISEESKKLELNEIKTYRSDVFDFLKNCKSSFDIIFADPPYESGHAAKIPTIVFEKKLLNESGWLIVEHSEKQSMEVIEGFKETRTYGNVGFSFFQPQSSYDI
jgi:16S rRNA (guanine966-N2)-methyltransferase